MMICTDKRTVTWRTMPKSKDDSAPVAWKCKGCGAMLGLVQKDNRNYHYLILPDVPYLRIYGNAEVTCVFCNCVRKWWWDEVALDKLVYNIKRRKRI